MWVLPCESRAFDSIGANNPHPGPPRGGGRLILPLPGSSLLVATNENTTSYRPRAARFFFTTYYKLRTTYPFLLPHGGRWLRSNRRGVCCAGGGKRDVGGRKWVVGLLRNERRTLGFVNANNPHPSHPPGEGVLLCRNPAECFLLRRNKRHYKLLATSYKLISTGHGPRASFSPPTTHHVLRTTLQTPTPALPKGRESYFAATGPKDSRHGETKHHKPPTTGHKLLFFHHILRTA